MTRQGTARRLLRRGGMAVLVATLLAGVVDHAATMANASAQPVGARLNLITPDTGVRLPVPPQAQPDLTPARAAGADAAQIASQLPRTSAPAPGAPRRRATGRSTPTRVTTRSVAGQPPGPLTPLRSGPTAFPATAAQRPHLALVSRPGVVVAQPQLGGPAAHPYAQPATTGPADPAIACGDVAGLIAAITSANASAGPTTIRLAEDCTYDLTAPIGATGDGLPPVTSAIIVEGHGAAIRRDPGAPPFRILEVQAGGTLTLRHLAVRGGRGYAGGGILNGGTLTLSDSRVSENAAWFGGGIASVTTSAVLTLDRSRVNDNTASYPFGALGGGIFTAGPLTLLHSWVKDNTASCSGSCTDAFGGGIFSGGTLTTTGSHVSDNTASCSGSCLALGGGMVVAGTAAILGTWVSDNTASCSGSCLAAGGGIEVGGTVVLATSRVTENAASCSGTGCRAAGGGVLADGQLISLKSEIEKNTVRGSTALGGGGIFLWDYTATLSTTKVKRNHPDNCAPAGSISGCV